jgi:glycosyltransferase involved in cell wall biosynthesis
MRHLRVAFVLPGLHRVNRGAEVAFESIGSRLARSGGFEVTLIGSGASRRDQPYRFRSVPCVTREFFQHWPSAPLVRTDCMYEELSFAPRLWSSYRPGDYDVTVTCSYPYTNWVLRARKAGGVRPAHVFVTQNGDYPCLASNREFRFFSCDGLVCTNPEYYERHRARWRSVLIPNGVDPERFRPGRSRRDLFRLPDDAAVALMVSALVPSKRVIEGIRSVSRIKDLHLVVAGDGPLRQEVERCGRELLGPRFRRVTLPRSEMPLLYRSVDLLLHMSQDEPSANAYVEALAVGLPIVTHDRLVTRWTLEGQGLLVNTDVPGEVAEGIARALEMRSPEHVTARREVVERRFSWGAISQEYGRFFREVAASSGVGDVLGRAAV